MFEIQVFKNLCFLTVHACPTTQRVLLVDNGTPVFLLGNNENYAFIDIKSNFLEVSSPEFASRKESRKNRSHTFKK